VVCRDSTLRANLIASCSDEGIYLNSAARSKLIHNTVVGTGGISVRCPASSAEIEGNLVEGIIRSRDSGILRLGDNRTSRRRQRSDRPRYGAFDDFAECLSSP
jgi:parallel beta-helix repeat protein